MTPFPEGEDMTVKRLYVALKRGDEQLLKMGAHKLHEKYYSGFEFRMLDDLKGILDRLGDQRIPNDIKDLLTRTITNILNGVKPEYTGTNQGTYNSQYPQNYQTPAQDTAQSQLTIQIPSENQTIQTALGPIPAQVINEGQETVSSDLTIETTADTNYQNNEPIQPYQTNDTYASYRPSFHNSDIAVFYDDKTGFIDYDKMKAYRLDLSESELNRESNPLINASQIKQAIDTNIDEANDVLFALKKLNGNIDFITSSKSANILRMLDNLDVKYSVSNIQGREVNPQVTVYPLFGLSNIFVCPKCGKREYFVDNENKVLSLQCTSCASTMFPDVSEAKNFESNATPLTWLKGLKAMNKSDVWVLINPPLESSRALTCEFLKTALTMCRPKKVCVYSKDSSIKEYYRQLLKEITPSAEVKTEFANCDTLLHEVSRNMNMQAV